jgi:hypothetical protein
LVTQHVAEQYLERLLASNGRISKELVVLYLNSCIAGRKIVGESDDDDDADDNAQTEGTIHPGFCYICMNTFHSPKDMGLLYNRRKERVCQHITCLACAVRMRQDPHVSANYRDRCTYCSNEYMYVVPVDPSTPDSLQPVFQLLEKDFIGKLDFEKGLEVLQLDTSAEVSRRAWRLFHKLKSLHPRILAAFPEELTKDDVLHILSGFVGVPLESLRDILKHQDRIFGVDLSKCPDLHQGLMHISKDWLTMPPSEETLALYRRFRRATVWEHVKIIATIVVLVLFLSIPMGGAGLLLWCAFTFLRMMAGLDPDWNPNASVCRWLH